MTLYVTGQVVVSKDGTVASAAANPERFAIYATGTNPVSLGIDTSFYGVVYAPKAPLQISGSGEFFGAFVARRIDVGANAKVHYDAALRGD